MASRAGIVAVREGVLLRARIAVVLLVGSASAACGRFGFDAVGTDDALGDDGPATDDAGPTSYTDLTEASAWSTFDTTTVHPGASGFVGSVFDGQHLYLVPSFNGTINGIVVRHDTRGAFADAATWSSFDTTTVHTDARGFRSGIFDGRYVYLVPSEIVGGLGGVVTRYDTQQDFGAPAAWSTFDTETLNANAVGYMGARFDGRYIYFIPYANTVIARYDTQASFTSSGAWTTFDVATVVTGMPAMVGAIFDGRYLYLVPFIGGAGTSGRVVRYDTQASLVAPAAWEKFDTTAVSPNAKGFCDGAFDGRYLYLAPLSIASGMQNGTVTRFDTQASFTTAASWTTFDLTTIDPTAKGYFGATYDGRYVYFAPYPNKLVARYDTSATFTSAAAWGLFDATTIAAGARDYYGASFDGDDVYFVPHYNSTVTRFRAKASPSMPQVAGFGGSFF